MKSKPVNLETCRVQIRCDGIELINTGIKLMYPDIKIKGRYYDAVKEFYFRMKDDSTVFEQIIRHLEKQFIETRFFIKQGKDKFRNTDEYNDSSQALLIYLYTTSSNNSIYYKLNEILRDHMGNCNDKTITSEDRNIAPYAAALTATLLHWEYLKATHKTTYRGINSALVQDDPLIWLSFTSTSLDKKQSENYGTVSFYTITNTADTRQQWLPKLIHNFSAKPDEQEALYPPGSVFKIITKSVTGTGISYDITLMDQTKMENCYLTNQLESVFPENSKDNSKERREEL